MAKSGKLYKCNFFNERMEKIQKKILSWYAQHKRSLPWRQTTDPYKILVSEVMLQQTQAGRVICYYDRFLEKYPTIKALATARKRTLLKLWSGLGYNSRALRLQELAKFLMEKNNGEMPRRYETLESLPGIGPYTAAAIMAFAYNKEAAAIDTNIRRVLIHELKLPESISMEKLKKTALRLVPKGKSRLWHNALMDYGALHLTAKKAGINPVYKQSPFQGSDRQIRGKMLKKLIQRKQLKLRNLSRREQRIVVAMEADGLVRKEGVFLRIA